MVIPFRQFSRQLKARLLISSRSGRSPTEPTPEDAFRRVLRTRWRDRRDRAVWYYLPLFLLSLLTLILIGMAAQIVTWPVDGLEWQFSQGLVYRVVSGGPGQQAGVQPGDVALAIDGRPLADAPPYLDQRPGQQVVLTLRRGAEIRAASLRLAAPDAAAVLPRIVPVIVALIFWGTALVIFLLRPRAATSLAFFALGQTTAVILAAGLLSTVYIAWASRLFTVALCALPPLLVVFYHSFGVLNLPQKRRWWRAMLLFSLLLALPFLLWPRSELVRNGWYGYLQLATRVYVGLALLAVAVALIYTYFTTPSVDLRRRLRGLAFGLAIGALPLVFLSLLPNVLWGMAAAVPYELSFLFLGLVPISHAYVIVQQDLLPLDRFVNRSLVVFTLGMIWAGLYLGGVGLALLFFHTTPFLYPVAGALVTMAMAALFPPLRERVQRAVDHLFYGGWYDYRTVIAQLSRSLSGVATRQDLARSLVGPVSQGLQLQGAALYLRTSTGELALAGCQGLDLADEPPSGLGQAASEEGSRPRLEASGGWTLPLSWEGQLNGLLLLGPRRADDFHDPADEEILKTLQEQAALATANVFLVDELRQTLVAVQAAQRKMAEAREEERRVLAWELHDGPVQDLVALSYQLCVCRDQINRYDPALADELEEVRREATRIMRTARDMCSVLRVDVLDVLGVQPAMRQYAYDLMQETGLVVYLDMARAGTKIADPLGIALFRIFQESLNNVVQHADVPEVWTYFQIDGDSYDLRIWDKGKGFKPPLRLEYLALEGHYGVLTMKERMAGVHGYFDLQSQPGQGVSIRAWGQISQGIKRR